MSPELETSLRLTYRSKSGRLPSYLKEEFIQLCRTTLNANPDMECGKCVYKHMVRLHDILLIKDTEANTYKRSK